MTLEEKKQQLMATLLGIKNSQERFAYVVGRGRQSPALEADFKTESFRVEGCLARLWFVPEFKEGRCWFRVDSDSTIVKGIAVILADFYSDQKPGEIVMMDPSFLEQAGITQHLTPNRRNSLGRVWEKIREFAKDRIESETTENPLG